LRQGRGGGTGDPGVRTEELAPAFVQESFVATSKKYAPVYSEHDIDDSAVQAVVEALSLAWFFCKDKKKPHSQ
jgi:hypothetical protein